MDILRKAAQQALETLKDPWAAWPQGIADTIIALEAALAQPQRKPLTGLELCEIFDATEHMSNPVIAFARGIERVHGIE
jgi:hypothetical protein